MTKSNYDPQRRALNIEDNDCPITISFESSEPETCIWHYVFLALSRKKELSAISNDVK